MRRRARHPSLATLAVALGAMLLPRVALCAWPHDPTLNVQLAPSATDQNVNATVSDGAGGAIVVWFENRSGSIDIYAQHVTATSGVAPGWPAGGLLLCGAASTQDYPVATSDGAGGAIVAWEDLRDGVQYDIYALRVKSDGTIPVGWPANGRLLSTLGPTKNDFNPKICADGVGGAIVVWEYQFTPFTDTDVYAARVSGTGALTWSNFLYAPLAIQSSPAITSDGAAGAIVAFADNASGNFHISAVRVNSFGNLLWGATPVCAAPNDQIVPVITSDGSGGAIITWNDFRGGGSGDIYAQRITAAGAISPGWVINGDAVCLAGFTQSNPAIVSDGNHGAIITWMDPRNANIWDIYAMHLLPSGLPAPGWAADGNAICTAPHNQQAPTIDSDGAGGAIISWWDGRSGVANTEEIYAQRVTASGGIAPGWSYDGTPVCLASARQYLPFVVSDGAGGAVIAWLDSRNGISYQAYAQQVDLFGQLGGAAPAITRVKDIAFDQGGKLRIDWSASYLDANPTFGISNYWIWRQAPPSAAMEAVRRGGAWLDAGLEAELARGTPADWDAVARRGLFQMTTVDGVQVAWEYLAAQPASGFPSYSYVASTTSDSIAGYNPFTKFMVQARGTAIGTFWGSPVDSGYSADNLPPAAPAPFVATYASGATSLHWGRNTEPDFALYRLYRGSSPGFVPGPSTFVVEKADTGYVDPAGAPYYYRVCAFDIHGNVSPCPLVSPSGTTGVDDSAAPRALWLGPAVPNPMRESASLRYVLPREMRVSLAIYDASGRRVREIESGVVPAGEHAAVWDGRDASGHRVSTGLYFVRLDADGRALNGRILAMR